MRIKIIFAGVLPLFVIYTIVPCHGEAPLPANSYGVPPREGPSPSYGPPAANPNSKPQFGGPPSGPPSSNYGPPPPPPGQQPQGGGGSSPDSEGGSESAKPEPFSFMYEVKDAASGNDYSHKQESDGKTVKGEYKVLLPDGRNQIVTYTADDGGYNAQVKYDGEAKPAPMGGGGASAPMPGGGAPAMGGVAGGGGSKPGGGAGGGGGGGGGGGFAGYPSGVPSQPTGGNSGYPSGGPGGFPPPPPPPPSSGGNNGYPRGGPQGGMPGNSYLPPGSGGYK